MNQLHFAVVVGIDSYPQIGSLTAAHSDAQIFFEWVTAASGGGVPAKTNARLILSELRAGASPEQVKPTREQINEAIEVFKEKVREKTSKDPRVWPSTRLYFFAAGHGIAPGPRDA